jgi:hypothetical protein
VSLRSAPLSDALHDIKQFISHGENLNFPRELRGRIYEASSSNPTFSVWQCTFVTRCTAVCTRGHASALSAFSSAEYLPREAMAHISSSLTPVKNASDQIDVYLLKMDEPM